MADFTAVLKKTIDGLGEHTPEMRARVYAKARATISAKLAAISPPPPAAVAERQRQALEEAIAAVERGYAKPAKPAGNPLDELESVFAALDPAKQQAATPPRPAAPPPATPQPVVPSPAAAPAKPAPAQGNGPTQARPAAPLPAPAPAEEPEFAAPEPEDDLEEENDRRPEPGRRPVVRRRFGGMVATAVILVALAGGGAALWMNRDAFTGPDGGVSAPATPSAPAAQPSAPEEAAAPEQPGQEQPAQAGSDKFTQRLLPDGNETDPGPANGEPTVAEGTSVASSSQPADGQPEAAPDTGSGESDAGPAGGAAATAPEAQPDGEDAVDPAQTITAGEQTSPAASAPAAGEALAVAQRAIFYEERTSAAEGSAQPGSIVWTLVKESPGNDQPPEPAIRAEATIPAKNLQLRMTIRRNADPTLPASHIVEMIFLTPQGFEGGGIENVLRIAMKTSEQEAGSPLLGIPAKIADGYFLVALNDSKADQQANETLLQSRSWIDIPIVYKSGRRALITMEKGIPGEKIFDEALKDWQAKSG